MYNFVCALILLLTSCLHVSDNSLTNRCDSNAGVYACQGLNVHNVKLIIHVPIYVDDDDLDVSRIVEYVAYAQTHFYNANIIFDDVEIVSDMPPYQLSYNTMFENIDVFHQVVINDPRGIHIFVVNSIHNIKKPNLEIMGLQYSRYERSCRNAIFITGDVSKQTFMHELGHYFGLQHVVDIDNIMHRGIISRKSDATFYCHESREKIRPCAVS